MRSKRKLVWWGLVIIPIAVLGLILLLGRSGDEAGTDDTDNADNGTNPGVTAGPEAITITADTPARIAAVGSGSSIDLGTTPTTFDIDAEGYWEIVAFDPQSTKQQVVARTLSPGQPLEINFSFATSRNWSTPLEEEFGVVAQPLATNRLAGVNPQTGQLHNLIGETIDFADLSPVRSVVWLDEQNYAWLDWSGKLTLVRPSGGFAVEDAKSVDGNDQRVVWLNDSGDIEIYDWQSGQRARAGVEASAADGLLVGERNLYLTGHHEAAVDGPETAHPTGWVDIYRLSDYGLSGRVSVHGPVHSLAEIDHYSFWQVGNELYVVDTNTAQVSSDWGFIRSPVDLLAASDHNGRPTVYILNELGEVWDFNLERQTYNLVGRAPSRTDWPGFAFPKTLVEVDGQLYFGFRLTSHPDLWYTFRLRPSGP